MKNPALRIFGLLLLAVSLTAILFSPAVGYSVSETSTVGLTGRVAADSPSEPPKILKPIDGETQSIDPIIIVSGTCYGDLMVEVYVNDIFAGSVVCENGKFSVEVTLNTGDNKIVARSVDNLDQASPDSSPIVVYFNVISKNLRLTSKQSRKSINPNSRLSWSVTLSGGNAPYAVYVDWGDGGYGLKSITDEGDFLVEHSYRNAGIYKITLRAQDIDNDRTILQLVAVVNGRVPLTVDDSHLSARSGVAWWVIALFLMILVSSFWFGRRYERRLKKSKL